MIVCHSSPDFDPCHLPSILKRDKSQLKTGASTHRSKHNDIREVVFTNQVMYTLSRPNAQSMDMLLPSAIEMRGDAPEDPVTLCPRQCSDPEVCQIRRIRTKTPHRDGGSTRSARLYLGPLVEPRTQGIVPSISVLALL